MIIYLFSVEIERERERERERKKGTIAGFNCAQFYMFILLITYKNENFVI